jgi:hypothetical protein
VAKVGRPKGSDTFTEAKAAAVYERLRKRASLPDAFALSDIVESTGRNWMKSHPDFLEGVKKARAEARAAAMEVLERGETGQSGKAWQSAAWFLERSDFEHWGNKTRQEHTGADGGPIRVTDMRSDTPATPERDPDLIRQLSGNKKPPGTNGHGSGNGDRS